MDVLSVTGQFVNSKCHQKLVLVSQVFFHKLITNSHTHTHSTCAYSLTRVQWKILATIRSEWKEAICKRMEAYKKKDRVNQVEEVYGNELTQRSVSLCIWVWPQISQGSTQMKMLGQTLLTTIVDKRQWTLTTTTERGQGVIHWMLQLRETVSRRFELEFFIKRKEKEKLKGRGSVYKKKSGEVRS